MAVEVAVPALGENIEEAMFGGWNKRLGDYVEQGETLFQVESDKATLDVEAPASGYLLEIRVEEGEAVTAGQVIGRLGQRGE